MSDHSAYTNNSTVRTFAVLELLGRSGFPLSLTAIADASNLDKATVRRFLITLTELGYVERIGSGEYRLTSRILELSTTYLRTVSLPHEALPFLEAFCRETGTATSVAILDGTTAIYVAHMSVTEALSIGVRIGTRLPAHATAAGKMLLAMLSPEDVASRYPDEILPTFTAYTTTRVTHLIGALQEIRRQGWALNEEEYETGVRAAACPLRSVDGKVMSVLNVSTRTDQIDRLVFFSRILPSLLRTGDAISHALSEKRGARPESP